MPTLRLGPDALVLQADYDDRKRCKSVPGYRWSKASKTWLYPRSYHAALGLLKEFGPDVNLENGIKEWIRSEYEKEKQLQEIREGKHLEDAPSYFYRHQKICYQIALRSKRHGFYLDCGLGKTALSLEIIKAVKGRWLVVCPLSIITSAWLEDVHKWTPELRAVNLWDKSKAKRLVSLSQEADIYIPHY